MNHETMLLVAKKALESVDPSDVVRVTFDQGQSPNGYAGMTINVIFNEPNNQTDEKTEEWLGD
ncbi:hypothetical protein ACQV2S_01190 [Facklamia sp. P13064]|uniref:hypothetical protein n=1 Tax=Facklamia sp. P13064 TaxID=3421953 RepID=UPI003D1754E3